MKLKKFFAGVVAAAMMLTMGATVAFAAAPTGEKAASVENGSSFTITKTYSQAAKDAGLYADEILLEAGKPTLTNNSRLNSTDVENKTLTFTSNTVDANGVTNSGEFNVKLPEYEAVGVYTYTVKEVAGKTAGVVYNSNGFQIVVTVVNNAKGDGFDCYVRLNNDKGVKTGDIQNDFKDNSLTVEKEVTGNLGDKNQYFDFTITLNAPEGKNVNNAITIVSDADKLQAKIVNAADGAKAALDGAEIKFNGDSSVQVQVTLKHGQNVKLDNLPVGVTYTVTENGTEGNKNGAYTVSYDDGCNGTINAEKASAAKVTNNYSDGTVDTGVILDNAPYIALLAIVAFGGVALILNKRRRDEE